MWLLQRSAYCEEAASPKMKRFENVAILKRLLMREWALSFAIKAIYVILSQENSQSCASQTKTKLSQHLYLTSSNIPSKGPFC